MTIEQMKKWIDEASYQQLFSKWRFEPVGSPWFQGEVGDYFTAKFKEKRELVSQEEHVATSKVLG